MFSGSSGPLYHVKSLVVVTLAACKHAVPHSMLSWRNTLVSEVHGPIIWVDTDAKAELQTRRALAATKLAGLIRWEGPCRSFGTSPSSQRIYFRGYFDERWVTALTARLHVTTLKSQQSLGRALIGSQSLLTDPSALLAEISSVQAATEIAPLCDEIVVVSSQLAILHTSCSKTLWEERLTELLQKSPDSSVDKLKWRPSRHGGRPWVKPITLDARAVRARALAAAREDKEAAMSAVVTIHGSLGAAPFALIQKVMDRIAESLGVILEPADPDNALRTYQWREFRDAADECTGAIKLTLSTPCEVQLLFARVRGAAVEVGGQQMFVEVQNLYQYMAALPPDLLTHTAASMRDVTAPRSTRGNAGGDRHPGATASPIEPGNLKATERAKRAGWELTVGRPIPGLRRFQRNLICYCMKMATTQRQGITSCWACLIIIHTTQSPTPFPHQQVQFHQRHIWLTTDGITAEGRQQYRRRHHTWHRYSQNPTVRPFRILQQTVATWTYKGHCHCHPHMRHQHLHQPRSRPHRISQPTT